MQNKLYKCNFISQCKNISRNNTKNVQVQFQFTTAETIKTNLLQAPRGFFLLLLFVIFPCLPSGLVSCLWRRIIKKRGKGGGGEEGGREGEKEKETRKRRGGGVERIKEESINKFD